MHDGIVDIPHRNLHFPPSRCVFVVIEVDLPAFRVETTDGVGGKSENFTSDAGADGMTDPEDAGLLDWFDLRIREVFREQDLTNWQIIHAGWLLWAKPGPFVP